MECWRDELEKWPSTTQLGIHGILLTRVNQLDCALQSSGKIFKEYFHFGKLFTSLASSFYNVYLFSLNVCRLCSDMPPFTPANLWFLSFFGLNEPSKKFIGFIILFLWPKGYLEICSLVFKYSQDILLFLISSLIPVWKENIFSMISILWNALRQIYDQYRVLWGR